MYERRSPNGAEGAPAQGRAFGALRHRDFQLFWGGGVISQVGSWMQQVAQGWLVYELTGSALHVGLNGLFQAVPFILVSLYAGTVVDRMDRKKILIAVESFSTLVVLVIGVLVATGNIQVWHIYAASVAYSLAGGFESPARQALIRHLVPPADLMTAVSLTSIQRKGAQIIGPTLGGLFVASFGIAGTYFINAAGRFVLLWCLFQMRTHTPINERPRQNPLHDIAEGIQYVRAETVIGTLILMEAIMSVFGSYQVMMVVFANEVFGVGPAGMGLLQSASGAGSVAGSFGLAILGDVRRKGRLLLISGVVYGLSLLAFALCPWYIAALPILLVVGASDIVFGATRSTMLQLLTPHTMLGRVMSLSSISMRGLGQLGGAQTGAVASIFGVQWAVALGALICAGFTIGSSWRVPLVRNFTGVEASPPPARGERPPDRRSDAEEPVAAR